MSNCLIMLTKLVLMKYKIHKIRKLTQASFKILTLVIAFSFLSIVITASLPILHHHALRTVNISKETHQTLQKHIKYVKCSLCDFYNNIFNTFYPDNYNLTFQINSNFYYFPSNEATISLIICSNNSRDPPVL